MLDVGLRSADLRTTTKALVDTGSTRTIFPRGIGDLLGVEFPDFRSNAPKKITLMARDWPAVTETVELVSSDRSRIHGKPRSTS